MLRNDDGDGLQHDPAKIKPSRVLFGATLFCLRWARENGCEWDTATRDRAAEELGYTDDLGNLVQESTTRWRESSNSNRERRRD